MKNFYEAPVADVIELESEDVITISSVATDNGENDNELDIGSPSWN